MSALQSTQLPEAATLTKNSPDHSAKETSTAPAQTSFKENAQRPMDTNTATDNRLTRIILGEQVKTETHSAVAKEQVVLEVDNFQLWYGAKQALHGISMNPQKQSHRTDPVPLVAEKSTLLRSVNHSTICSARCASPATMRLRNGDSIYKTSVDVIELRKRMGYGLSKPESFSDEHLRKRYLRSPISMANETGACSMEFTRAQPTHGAARFRTKSKDRLHDSALWPFRRSATAALHRARRRLRPENLKCCYSMSLAQRPTPSRQVRSKGLIQELRGGYSV